MFCGERVQHDLSQSLHSGIGSRRLSQWRADHIGFVFQNYHLMNHLTAKANVEMGLRFVSSGREVDEAEAVLNTLGMGCYIKKRTRDLSGGQKQRISVARALVKRPDVLLADEPTGNLDTANKCLVLASLLIASQRYGATVILVTHEIEHPPLVASRSIVMRDAQISEDRKLMVHDPLDLQNGGVYSSLGNTFVGDPEAERVADYVQAGTWISADEADEIILTMNAARALLQQLPDVSSVSELIGKKVWLALPSTFNHDPAASAQVSVAGIYDHLRDGACMTTPAVIQKMYSRIMAEANGTWEKTYRRMNYRIAGVASTDPHTEEVAVVPKTSSVPLLCWRYRNLSDRWIVLPEQLGVEDMSSVELTLRPEGAPSGTVHSISGECIRELPESPYTDLEKLRQKHPDGFALCSPRLWNELGFDAAPEVFTASWQPEAHYAYFYFSDLETAREARSQLQRHGLSTYMPIDRFAGLLSLVHIVTMAAGALMITILGAGTLGIVVTLFTEVDAGAAEIGLLKALGASNQLVGSVFLLKGAFIGIIGAAIGIPSGIILDGLLNHRLAGVVAEQSGLASDGFSLFYHDPWFMLLVAVGVIVLAASSAVAPALLAARRDPQEALRDE